MASIRGQQHEGVLVDSNDEPVLRPDGTGYPQVTPASVKDGRIKWLGAGNAVMSTDIMTGQTQRKFTVERHTDDVTSSQALFTAEKVVVLVDNADGANYQFVRYNRSTGEELTRTVLDKANDDPGDGMILHGMASTFWLLHSRSRQ